MHKVEKTYKTFSIEYYESDSEDLGNESLSNRTSSSFGKGPFLYYVRVKGWAGGIGGKYLLFLTGVGGWF